MYFPDDPLHPLDPIFNAVPESARPRLIAAYAHDVTEPEWALGYRFDVILHGPFATPFEPAREPVEGTGHQPQCHEVRAGKRRPQPLRRGGREPEAGVIVGMPQHDDQPVPPVPAHGQPVADQP